MVVELAGIHAARKPWGRTDLLPWSALGDSGGGIGELWFERADAGASPSSLLLKLLFTSAPLSIQVHPDDAMARAIGQPNGKTEAWYILSATPGAQVAVGLAQELSAAELRASIKDGSIAEHVHWRAVAKGDVIFVPAGTIHAIGAGIVLAEIQQRSDTTFRLFDYGRSRALHVDDAVAAARPRPSGWRFEPKPLSADRTLLVAAPQFVLERIVLQPHARRQLDAACETWILVLAGDARIGPTHACVGEAVFVEADRPVLDVGADGMTGLVAYPGPAPHPDLLHDLGDRRAAGPTRDVGRPPVLKTAPAGLPVITTEAGS